MCNQLGAIAGFGFINWIILTIYILCVVCGLKEEESTISQLPSSLPSYSNYYQPSPTTPSENLGFSPGSTLSDFSGGSKKYVGISFCLMCRVRPKNGGYDFCGTTCRDKARGQTPLLLEVPRGHTTFKKVTRKFQESWKYGSCPQIRKVYRIVENSTSVETYVTYLHKHGNEAFRYHGTERSCQLGEDGQTTLCASSYCNACSIIGTSFKVSLANPGGA